MIKLTGLPKTPIHTLGLGVFDGLHLGHNELLKHCDYLLSFHPHPDIVLKKSTNLQLITTKRELRSLYNQMIFLEFTKEIASLEPEIFLNTIIKSKINPKRLIVGYDFKFGFKKQGTISNLQTWGEKNGIKIVVIPPYMLNNIPVKSGLIRTLIRENKFKDALAYLGHPFIIIGKVVKGDGRGKGLGFPTANLQVPPLKLIPTKGVYQGEVKLNNTLKPAIIYIGTKPTFNGEIAAIEVHIPNETLSLYGKTLYVTLTKKIRNEMHFSTSTELISQINTDLRCLA
jgi:riboflavin kinase / FMN adenylyltransferase